MLEVNIIGLDLAKNVFQAHGSDASGSVLFRKKLRRGHVLRFLAAQPACTVANGSVRRRPLLGAGDCEAGARCSANRSGVREAFREAAEDGMVAALPRRHRNVPSSWCSTPREGEDGK